MNDYTNGRWSGPFPDFASLLSQLFQQNRQAFEQTPSGAGEPDDAGLDVDALLEQLKAQADLGFEQLQEQVRSLQVPHEAMLAAAYQLGTAQSATQAQLEALERFWPHAALLPKLGLFQQRQDRLEAAAAALAQLRRAQDNYLALLRRMTHDAIDEFHRRLSDLDGQAVGLKQLYELWLTAGESAYEQSLGSDAYARSLGELANTGAEVNRHLQEGLDEFLQTLNLPTRREMNSTQQRLQELRRRQYAAERVDAGELAGLRAEMAEMRRQLEELRGQQQPLKAAKPRPARRRKHAHQT